MSIVNRQQHLPHDSTEVFFLAKVRDGMRQKIRAVQRAQQFIQMTARMVSSRRQLQLSAQQTDESSKGSSPPQSAVKLRYRRQQQLSNSSQCGPLEASPAASELSQIRRKTIPMPSVAIARRMSREQFSLHRLPELNASTGHRVSQPDALLKMRSRRPRRPELGRKFKAAAWISIIIRRLCLANLRNTEDSDSPYMKNIKFVDNMVKESETNLLFNTEQYKANREMRLSEVSKLILIKPRWARTDQELLHVEIILRSIKDYADYPVAIQRRIAEVGEYLKYESRRIIVREGHPAWNFYFILSGSVVVLVMDEDRRFVQPKAILKRGQSFGDLAIVNGDKRRSTIVAMEEVEMLSIWYEDYEAIFMDGGVLKSEDSFITNLNFIVDWPIEVADQHPALFRYYFYKRGDVVVRDSNRSSWIIVVKSGSLSVLKRLRKVKPFEWRRRRLQHSHGSMHSTGDGAAHTAQKVIKSQRPKRAAGVSDVVSSPHVTLKGLREIGTLDADSFKEEILTASNELDRGYYNTQLGGEGDDTPCNPMFVHIQTLTTGQTFGLYELVLGQQPSFCVVSNGAEVIMIDKNLYAEHVNDEILKRIRLEAQAYPTDAELQDSLQTAVDWDAYKSATLRSAVSRSNKP